MFTPWVIYRKFTVSVFGVKFLNRVDIRNFHECYPLHFLSKHFIYLFSLLTVSQQLSCWTLNLDCLWFRSGSDLCHKFWFHWNHNGDRWHSARAWYAFYLAPPMYKTPCLIYSNKLCSYAPSDQSAIFSRKKFLQQLKSRLTE